MEFKVNDYQLPEVISCNYEELKNELTERVQHYETIVFTEDQVKDAKADRANLNKLADAIDNERKRIKKEYLKPYDAFEAQVKELVAIVKKPIGIIDTQIKEFEQQQKDQKKDFIFAEFENIKAEAPDNAKFIVFSQTFNEKWLNASVSMSSIKAEIKGIFDNVSLNVSTLETLPDFSFEAVELYKQTLDMGRAIQEAKRMSDMQKAKEEAKRQQAQNDAMKVLEEAKKASEEAPAPITEERSWISFKAYITTADAAALKDFFISRGIEFKPI